MSRCHADKFLPYEPQLCHLWCVAAYAASHQPPRATERNGTPHAKINGSDLEHAVARRRSRRCSTQNLLKVFEEGSKVMADLHGQAERQRPDVARPRRARRRAACSARSCSSGCASRRSSPQAQTELMQSYMELWSRSMRRMMGEAVEPVAAPEPGDNRFKDQDWTDNPYFDFWKQAYLLTSRWAEDARRPAPKASTTKHAAQGRLLPAADEQRRVAVQLPHDQPGSDARDAAIARREPGARHGASRRRHGERSDGSLKISQTDTSAFEVGQNVATTPGKVVFQND